MLRTEHFYTAAEIQWFNLHGGLPRWTDPKEKQFDRLTHESERQAVYLMFNAGAEAAAFHVLPMPNDARWRPRSGHMSQSATRRVDAAMSLLWTSRRRIR